MKGDFSRRTFDPNKHLAAVPMQQGRAQLDADWNEQLEISAHRTETETRDVIGEAGGPIHNAGFEVTDAGSGDLFISKGRYYVGGLLVENEATCRLTAQPDLPSAPPITSIGTHFVYLDVWQRHLTALEDPSIRETALGGPDTAARVKTVWQLKVIKTGKSTCKEALAELAGPSQAALLARETPAQTSTDPCLVPAGSGYKGLENQLYRVEIHSSGPPAALPVPTGAIEITLGAAPNEVTLASGTILAGQYVEVFSPAVPGRTSALLVCASAGTSLTLSGAVPLFPAGSKLYVRAVQTVFKWSRDNGSVATRIIEIKNKEVTVADLGRDDVLGFAVGQWVEIFDDRAELIDASSELHQIASIDRAARKITLRAAPAKLAATASGVDTTLRPRLRRWDGTGAVSGSPDPTKGFFDLESGIQVQFSGTAFRPHEYWQIPARVATAEDQTGRIEWPTAKSLPPAGIHHRYAAIALLTKTDTTLTIHDCRDLFPPLTELCSLFYLGGDGQEVLPDLSSPSTLVTLADELRVGVANGEHPVPGAYVRFTMLTPGDKLSPGTGIVPYSTTVDSLTVKTNAKGVASCVWGLLPSSGHAHRVRAELLDELLTPIHLPVVFGATLSTADQVAYLPPKDCATLQGARTVQEAIDKLCAAGGGCELVLRPGMTEEQIERLVEEAIEKGKGSAKVCFSPGEYSLRRALRFRRGNHLMLSGAGDGSFIHLANADRETEPTVEIGGFQSVVVRDLRIENAISGSPEPGTPSEKDPLEGLAGALTFTSCGSVLVENVTASCASGPARRGAACIAVRGAKSSQLTRLLSVRILHCRLRPGRGQIGALVIDATRAQIEDNVVLLQSDGKDALDVDRLTSDARFRTGLRRAILYNTTFGNPIPAPEYSESDRWELRARLRQILPQESYDNLELDDVIAAGTTFPLGGHRFSFHTPISLVQGVLSLFRENEASFQGMSAPKAQKHAFYLVMREVERALKKPESAEWKELGRWLARAQKEHMDPASQGIVVAGALPSEVRIVGNTVSGALAGIHVGLSARSDKTKTARRVLITGNTVTVPLRVVSTFERHGIFVGNSESTLIEHNVVHVERTALPALFPIDGIRAYGYFGPLLLVRENHIEAATNGVLAHALNAEHNEVPRAYLWRVGDNVAHGGVQGAVTFPTDMVKPDHPNLP